MGWIIGALAGVYFGGLIANALGAMMRRRGYQAYVAAGMVIGFLICLTALMMGAALGIAADSGGMARLQVLALQARLPAWMFHDFGPFGAGVLGVLVFALPLIAGCDRLDGGGGRSRRAPDGGKDSGAGEAVRVEPQVGARRD